MALAVCMILHYSFSNEDSVSDLKLKDVNLVEAYYKWNNLLQKMAQNKCHGCIKLDEHMKLARELKRHREEVNALKFEMSDEALQQMPDFQGRVWDHIIIVILVSIFVANHFLQRDPKHPL